MGSWIAAYLFVGCMIGVAITIKAYEESKCSLAELFGAWLVALFFWPGVVMYLWVL